MFSSSASVARVCTASYVKRSDIFFNCSLFANFVNFVVVRADVDEHVLEIRVKNRLAKLRLQWFAFLRKTLLGSQLLFQAKTLVGNHSLL